eukprot:1388866-Rhodomonas_salina.2
MATYITDKPSGLLMNVPSAFLYWALSRKWFLCSLFQAKYNPVAFMHVVSGTTRDFVAFLGKDLHSIIDCMPQPGVSNDPRFSVGISVEPALPDAKGVLIPDIHFKYSMKRQSQLMLLFSAIRKWGLYANQASSAESTAEMSPGDSERALHVKQWDTNDIVVCLHQARAAAAADSAMVDDDEDGTTQGYSY